MGISQVRYGTNSRIDFLLSGAGPDCYVEVKSVTLCRTPGLAEFPDSVTARGAKHMAELAEMARAGHRAVVFFLVQRTDCTRVEVARDIDPAYAQAFDAARAAGARDIDPAYAQAFDAARAAGVEVIAHGTRITPEGIWLGPRLPVG